MIGEDPGIDGIKNNIVFWSAMLSPFWIPILLVLMFIKLGVIE